MRAKEESILYMTHNNMYIYIYVHVLRNGIFDFAGYFDENIKSVPDRGQKPD